MARATPNSRGARNARCAAAGAVVLALALAPAPLRPPHLFAETVEMVLGIGWMKAYLAAALVVHCSFYSGVGVLATFAVRRAASARGIALQAAALAAAVIVLALAIRAVRLGHVPVWSNAIVPLAACAAGVAIGLAVRYRGWEATAAAGVVAAAVTAATWVPGTSSDFSHRTQMHLERLIAAAPDLPDGEARFGALVRTAFAPAEDIAASASPIEHNRAALAALGIAIGHEGLARAVGLTRNGELVQRASALRPGTTLRGRDDWAQHYLLSAALAVVEHPWVSEAAGLMKEQLDAASHGTGFSFGDLAADRAGVRFAAAATRSDAAARATQVRLLRAFETGEFFPAIEDLPENLTLEDFKSRFGGVGSLRYRALIAEIDKRIDACAALSFETSRSRIP